jgi:dienelactone hydrolase
LTTVLLVLPVLSTPCRAGIVEEVLEVPVTAKNVYGREMSQAIKVTVFRDDNKARSPFLVLNHGRPLSAAGYATMGRVRYEENANYFVKRGFAVFVPTRIGYGASGGEDMEYAGTCISRNYVLSYEAAAQQVVKIIETAQSLSYVNADRGLVVGQSYGGVTSVAIAAKGLPGIVAAINFAGGGGGDPSGRPGNPCRADLLENLFAGYGKNTRIPTLWLYSQNDKLFGERFPKEWFDAFVKNGGEGEFIQLPPLLPPFGEDGHSTFTKNPAAWKPAVERFLTQIGF